MFLLLFDTMGFIHRHEFFTTIWGPVRFLGFTFSFKHRSQAVADPPTASGAFRHHGAVDGIARCLGDGGHTPRVGLGKDGVPREHAVIVMVG